jgi:methylated-DNA-[protein]-cysteine S-methyltransferase
MNLSGNSFKRETTTPFQQRVYRAVETIPAGMVTTYKLVALAIDCKSPRAIGQALRKNPFAPQVPCHRVIKSDLTIGGFVGCIAGEKIDQKLSLLKKEGVDFRLGKLVDRTKLYTF